MAIFTAEERRVAGRIARLGHANPFLPERIECEREVLGDEFVESDANWDQRLGLLDEHLNVVRIKEHAGRVAEAARARLQRASAATNEDLALYEDLVVFLLYHRYRQRFDVLIDRALARDRGRVRVTFFDEFLADFRSFFVGPAQASDSLEQAAHYFAGVFQVRRAFKHIFQFLIGRSRPMAMLRAQIWQSIFTHDFGRYRRVLYERMRDLTCLITGPTGSGKELAARAIGMSRYIPFDPHTEKFTEDFHGSFIALNLPAFSPTLIESELFGHKRGAFTGALQDRVGWLESCPARGTVFLDELGEIEPRIQVKLLRVIQERTFSRLGCAEERSFAGKLIAATNRDLARDMHEGRFRPDLYYRLCADLITTPGLREQLDDSPETLDELVLFLAARVVGEEEGPGLAAEVGEWIGRELGADYAWPGNVRELEQCVRNVLVRKHYSPPRVGVDETFRSAFERELWDGSLTADELLRHYCSIVYAQCGSYRETGRRIDLDQRTVKAKIDPAVLARLASSQGDVAEG
ncbi:sigma-54-dependent transcriptional regulator [Candidatus Sumerlaeota bacterium]